MEQQEQNDTILSIENIVKEAQNLKTILLPNHFKTVTREFITMLFEYCKKVPPKSWITFFKDSKNEKKGVPMPHTVAWLIDESPEFTLIYASMEKSYAKNQVIKTYILFSRRLIHPLNTEGANVFAHFICSIMVKVYAVMGPQKRNKTMIVRELGKEIYNGYTVFKNTESTMPSIWSKRLVVSLRLAHEYNLHSCLDERNKKEILEQEDDSDEGEEDDCVEDSEEKDTDKFLFKSIKCSNVFKESKSIEERIITYQTKIAKCRDKKLELMKCLNEKDSEEKEMLNEMNSLKQTHLQRVEDSFSSGAIRQILGNGCDFINNFKELQGVMTELVKRKPEGMSFLNWANENLMIKDTPEIQFIAYEAEFKYVDPTDPIIEPEQIKTPTCVSGWEENDEEIVETTSLDDHNYAKASEAKNQDDIESNVVNNSQIDENNELPVTVEKDTPPSASPTNIISDGMTEKDTLRAPLPESDEFAAAITPPTPPVKRRKLNKTPIKK